MNKSELYECSIIYGGMSLACILFHILPLIFYYPKIDKVFYALLITTTLWILVFLVCLIMFIVFGIKKRKRL